MKKTYLLIGILLIGLFYFGFKSPLVVQIDNANFNTQDNSLSWGYHKNTRSAGECFVFSGALSGILDGSTTIQAYLTNHEIDTFKSNADVTGMLVAKPGTNNQEFMPGGDDPNLNPPVLVKGTLRKEINDGAVYLCVDAPLMYGDNPGIDFNIKAVFSPNTGDIAVTTTSLTQANVTSTTIINQPVGFTTKTAIEQRQEGFFSWLWIKIKEFLGQ